MFDDNDQFCTVTCFYKDYLWNCMALLMLLINTVSYKCTRMGLVIIEALMWLQKKGFVYNIMPMSYDLHY